MEAQGFTPPLPKKSKAVDASSEKVTMTLYFDCKGPLLIDFLEHGRTWKRTAVQRAIKSKRSKMLTNDIILLHNNVRLHVAHVVSTTLQKFRWVALAHLPYSPDLQISIFLES